MGSSARFNLDILSLMALDHEFRFFECFTLQVIDINTPIRFFLRHHGSVIPCEEVVRALVCWNLRIQWAQFETIKF